MNTSTLKPTKGMKDMMFKCLCGGVMLVKEVERYPEGLTSKEKLEYERKCTVECPDCKTVMHDQKYD